ncbi:MAG: hypothetical protein H3C34_02050 [Caldilineaceae bacterium]|nr:hypothetical protein [Caldilineaceae bacterium]
MSHVRLLQLLHLADSALPIGATAHSFGLETLAENGELSPEQLIHFVRGYLEEGGSLEALYCRRARRLLTSAECASSTVSRDAWLALNRQLSARKTARESRAASSTLGTRLLRLVIDLEPEVGLLPLLQASEQTGTEVHYAVAFGAAGGALQLQAYDTVLALLRQTVAGMLAACQKLLPLGQSWAGRIQWQIQEAIVAAATKSETPGDDHEPDAFSMLLEVGSMRHPYLPVRLFIS